MKADNILGLIGGTPHVRLGRLFPDHEVWMKLERQNPAGSIKDRIALAMIEDAEQQGMIRPGATLIEATSGNTGVGLAFVAAVKGYRLIIVMPESMSVERRRLMQSYGARLELTPREKGMKGAIERAKALLAEIDGSWMPRQFVNPSNPEVHARTTAREIMDDFPEGFDYFVTGIGTGGHISGVGRELTMAGGRLYADRQMFVGGVYEDLPETSHFHSDLFVRLPDEDAGMFTYVYLLLSPGTRPDDVARGIAANMRRLDATDDVRPETPLLFPLTDIHLRSHFQREHEPNGNILYLYLIVGANILLLVIVLFNLWLNAGLIFAFNRRYYQLLRLNGASSRRVLVDEMMIATYVGFSSVAFMCIAWLLMPYRSPTMIWGYGGSGLRTTISVNGYWLHVLNDLFSFQEGHLFVPTGTFLFFSQRERGRREEEPPEEMPAEPEGGIETRLALFVAEEALNGLKRIGRTSAFRSAQKSCLPIRGRLQRKNMPRVRNTRAPFRALRPSAFSSNSNRASTDSCTYRKWTASTLIRI